MSRVADEHRDSRGGLLRRRRTWAGCANVATVSEVLHLSK